MPVGIDMHNPQLAVAVKSAEQLRDFLVRADRKYLVLNALDLLDCLPWPHAATDAMQLVSMYRDHRRVMESGWVEPVTTDASKTRDDGVLPAAYRDPVTREAVLRESAPVMMGELLEPDEVDEVILQLQRHKAQLLAERAKRGARRE